MQIELEVGRGFVGAGLKTPSLTRSRAQGIADYHARFQEAVLGGNVYTLSTPLAGTTVAAGGVVANPLLALVNPAGNRFAYTVWRTTFYAISGTVATGLVPYIMGTVPAALATTNVNAVNNLVGTSGSGTGKGYAAVTSAIANQVFWRPMTQFLTIPTAGYNVSSELIDGEVVVAPSGAFGINAPGTGTSFVCFASITYEEIQVAL